MITANAFGLSRNASSLPSPKPIVFIVDDDVSVRESIELLVIEAGWKPELFTRASEFVGRARVSVPCCLVLDINMPGLSGLELQEHVAVEQPDLPVIFITGYGDVPKTARAMKAGAVEFLQKPFRDSVLVDAIRSSLERSRAAIEVRTAEEELRRRYASLTPRERDVMALVVLGLMNKQVGGNLGISEITVKAHRGRVMQKMGMRTLADLVKAAASLGLPTGRHEDPSFF